MRKQIFINTIMQSIELLGQRSYGSTCFDMNHERILWSLDGLERSGV